MKRQKGQISIIGGERYKCAWTRGWSVDCWRSILIKTQLHSPNERLHLSQLNGIYFPTSENVLSVGGCLNSRRACWDRNQTRADQRQGALNT